MVKRTGTAKVRSPHRPLRPVAKSSAAPVFKNRLLAALPALDWIRRVAGGQRGAARPQRSFASAGRGDRGNVGLSRWRLLLNRHCAPGRQHGRSGDGGQRGHGRPGCGVWWLVRYRGLRRWCRAEASTSYRMTADTLRSEMDRRGALLNLADALFSGPDGRHHAVDGVQCGSLDRATARAVAVDGAGSHGHREFPLTQEFVAMMLGATRPTVTVVASVLQRAGLITYRRGRITVVNRARLESASCECYRAATHLLQLAAAPPA